MDLDLDNKKVEIFLLLPY